MSFWSAVLLIISGTVHAQSPNRLELTVNSVTTFADYRHWAGHPYVRLQDTAAKLGWYPQIDGYHRMADVARCLRLDFNSVRTYRTSYEPLVGKNAVAGVDRLPDLPVPTRLVQNELWLPLDAVARVMGYRAVYSRASRTLKLTSPVTLDYGTLEFSCQQFIKNPRG